LFRQFSVLDQRSPRSANLTPPCLSLKWFLVLRWLSLLLRRMQTRQVLARYSGCPSQKALQEDWSRWRRSGQAQPIHRGWRRVRSQ
jgi:hypothetical protein